MREIQAEEITSAVAKAVHRINYEVRPDILERLRWAAREEASPLGRQALELLLENALTAGAGVMPLCQDTGLAVIHVEIGQDVRVAGDLAASLQEGVRRASREGRLRNSVLDHPLRRRNTGDNTPAIIHYEVVPGKGLHLKIMTKGGGCENASAVAMLPPSAGEAGVVDFVVRTVEANGAAACPPLIVGVGVGGNFETAPLLSKKALFRNVGEPSPDPGIAAMEAEMLARINRLGLGPQGWGGTITALSVAVETAPCHIASLPVAVNMECHSHRMAEVSL